MSLTHLAFLAMLVTALTAAFARGGRTERIGGALFLAAAFASPLVQLQSFSQVEMGLAVVDILVLAGLCWLAFGSGRVWPVWATAFQALAVLTHLARQLAGPVDGDVYGDLLVLWSYPVLGALLWGSMREGQSQAAVPTVPETRLPPANAQRPLKPASAGPSSVNELQMLTRLLQDHGSGERAPQIARELLARTGSFAAAVNTPPAKLRGWGLDEQVIDAFAFARTITRATLRRQLETRPSLKNNAATVDYLHSELAHLAEEQFHVLYLNARHRLILDEVHSHGSVAEAPVIPREVVRKAIEVGALHIILAHNHPAGDPAPSRSDIAATRAVIDAARSIGVSVIDHIIISASGHVSMREAGLL